MEGKIKILEDLMDEIKGLKRLVKEKEEQVRIIKSEINEETSKKTKNKRKYVEVVSENKKNSKRRKVQNILEELTANTEEIRNEEPPRTTRAETPLDVRIARETMFTEEEGSIRTAIANWIREDGILIHGSDVNREMIEKYNALVREGRPIRQRENDEFERIGPLGIADEMRQMYLEKRSGEKKLVQQYRIALSCRKYAKEDNQEEIYQWYCYAESFQEAITVYIGDDPDISEKTAITGIYDGMLEDLDCTRETLWKRTEKARKIYRLFSEIGTANIGKIKVTSADAISKLTNEQIQELVQEVLLREKGLEEESILSEVTDKE